MEGDLDLQEWVQTSDSPLNSDDSYSSTTRGFGDLTINDANENDDHADMTTMLGEGEGEEEEEDVDGAGEAGRGGGGDGGERRKGRREEQEEAEEANSLLAKLAGKFDEFNSTTRNRYRFTLLTELSEEEKTTEPELVRLTDTCTAWPCYVIDDVWFKAKAYFGRKCKLPCCREYAHPHEWARHRRFLISKRYYLGEPGLTAKETDAVLRWADLVQSQEWKLGQWNERGVLHMKDKKTFPTDVVSWSAMEEHLATLAYSKKKSLLFLAARICVEALAKNKGLYTYNQQYWGFARICTDLLKTPYTAVQEGILLALQLYLRTLKIFHACFTTKCSELASAGLFPVLLDLLARSHPTTQAVIVNVIVLMSMHYNYISLVVNMGVLEPLTSMTSSPNDLLRRRVFGCLEVLAKNGPSQDAIVETGLLPTLVRQLSQHNPDITLSCLLTLNCLCHTHRALTLVLAVDNQLVVKAVMRLLSEREGHKITSLSRTSTAITKSLSLSDLQHGESWCTVSRQCLILATKLCVDRSASRVMVKRGIVGKLRSTWIETDSRAERVFIMDALAVMSRHPRAAEQICQQEFLPLITDVLGDRNYQEQVLQVAYNLSHRHLANLLDSGILTEMINAFGDKLFHRKLFPLILAILASTSSYEKVQALMLTNQAKAYTLTLDIAFSTTDMATLKPCVTTLGHMDATSVPLHVLKPNSLLLVAYIDKLLKAGSDSLVLHGLMQLRDLLQVECLHAVFREHHTQKVVQLLCHAPFKPPIQIMARAVLELMTGVRTRSRASSADSTSGGRGTAPSSSFGSTGGQGHEKVFEGDGGDSGSGESSGSELASASVVETETKAKVEEDGRGRSMAVEMRSGQGRDTSSSETDGSQRATEMAMSPVDVADVRVNVIHATDNEDEEGEEEEEELEAHVIQFDENDDNNNNNNNNNGDGVAAVNDDEVGDNNGNDDVGDDDDNDGFEIINMAEQDPVTDA